ncbi:DUF2789 family protein [Thiolinea disciformis]|uniref:DUF2789 family protein n=1 Tax=Thiolinea disciformis TaxID=125614 RepID=UPI000382228B|nr:DUF2789 family protein [Thiolinea disciformis]
MLGEIYDLPTLFKQLGLPNDEASIEQFIQTHQVPRGVHLSEADFWTESQSKALCQGWATNANWAGVIEELNVRLHEDA